MGQIETAVAERAVAPQVTPAAQIKGKLDQYRPVIAKLLTGTGISEETFVAQIANAMRAVPGLWDCQPESVLGAALRCAQLGLAPNDARNLAWILPYNRQAQFQLGYGGVMELARRAVPGLRFDGHAVYPNDEFDLDYGKPEPLTHRPAIARQMERGGEAYAWYVRATFPDGSVQIQVLDREGVEYHRRFSKQPKGKMWTESYDAAALKSCVTEMKRWLPSSAQLVAGFASDERVLDVRTIGADMADHELEAAPDNVDVETGEIIDDEPSP
jgi:recombination protein RecT